MPSRLTEKAQFLRPPRLDGVEALHATFVDHRYAPHFHETWTIAHVLTGAAQFDLEGRRYVAPAGNIFVIPPGAVHTGSSASEGGYTYRVLYLTDDRIGAPAGEELRNLRRRLPPVLADQRLITDLVRTHESLRFQGVTLEQGEACAQIGQRLRELIAYSEASEPRPHRAIAAARDYINEFWREDFTLDELAQAVGIGPYQLAHRFREQIGIPPCAYRRALRVQGAQTLLRTGLPPSDVALECGFYDQAHLTRHFKQMTGVTPARYAKAVR